MQFESVAAFLDMGGHGGYVWAAYGLTLAVLAWNLVAPWLARRSFLADEARRMRREEAQ